MRVRKHIYIIIAGIAAVATALCLITINSKKEPAEAATDMGATTSLRQALRADSLTEAIRKQSEAELNYYLDRHNVQDEGYEMVAAFSEGKRYKADSVGIVTVWNVGRWRNHKREGTAISIDHKRRVTIGRWEADTLVSGTRIDTLGTYRGSFAGGLADGHGSYSSADGTYYEGHWQNDWRDAFGLQLTVHEGEADLKVGQWKNDKYRGERLNYTSERIYGIDISRYQHGKGRKKYVIDWRRVRITHLGTMSRKKISGTVDYPVSFCFIKSTEGVSIRNPYFATDYAGARRHGIKTGAYHFFSSKRSGSAQAQFFLKNTRFSRGDLPPVLDLEPSRQQINLMGGVDAMFRNVRAWLQAVERSTGRRPILYVSQTFVNRYLSEAPDLKRDYRVWIARYGEYKPDVKLMFWQLCPDGRVQGIRGDVDINVFNGYKTQFDNEVK